MHAPLPNESSNRIDIPFEVPCFHRLRFTEDCFGIDWPILSELFLASDGPARIQVWIDEGLEAWDPQLPSRIRECIESDSDRMVLVSPVHRIAGGETIKNDPATVDQILMEIDRDNLDRRSYILVIGGGAVLDAVGFAAAIAHRGIRLIRIPTTTLAQADSGVGVKNAVNAFGKKNWKGTFAIPWAVVNDERMLLGLTDRDFRCGFSEAVKVSLLKNPEAFQFLVRNASHIARRDMRVAMHAIRSSVLMHLHHITQGGDPFEALEARPLDFGHWSAHKLEALTRYEVRHGEAVSIGVALDTAYSALTLGLSEEIVHQTLDTLTHMGLPIFDPWLERKEIFQGLEEFRQHLGGRLTLTMLRDVGQPVDVHEVDYEAMRTAVSHLKVHAMATSATLKTVSALRNPSRW